MAVFRGTAAGAAADEANWSAVVATVIGTAVFVAIPIIIAIKGPGHIHGSKPPFARLPWRLAPFLAIAAAPVFGGIAIFLRRQWVAQIGVVLAIVLGVASWVLLLR